MRENRITGLRAGWLMTNEILARLTGLDLVTSLDLSDSRRVTDEGLRHLARMPQLEVLNLTGCEITDHGLAVLRNLPALRSNSANRASRSSSSMDFAEWSNTLSAARTLTDGGVFGSTMTFNSVVTAALVACWSRATA